MCKIYTTRDDQYGPMCVFERAGRSFGVYVHVQGHTPFLEIIDRESRKLPPRDEIKGIAPDLDDVLNLSQPWWDDLNYLDLCERLKLDPYHMRPRYAPAYEHIAIFILNKIQSHRNSVNYDATFRDVLSLILDMLVEGTPLKPGPSWPVQFLPSEFGTGLRSDIAESWESSDCEPDGWSNSRYGHLAGIAYDFDTLTVWSRTVRHRLLAQGVLFLSKEVADQYLAGEGTHWRTVERKRGQTRIPSGGFFARLFQTETPLSDAAVITRHLARRAASDR